MKIWKSIPDSLGYEVSDSGDVRSIDRVVTTKSGDRRYSGKNLKIVKINADTEYRGVDLGRGNRRLVHTLVLEAFVGPRPEGMECRHLDGDASNNELKNLSWGTPEQNMQDRIRHGNNPHLNKTRCPRGHEHTDDNCVKYYLMRGQRSCLACQRAWAYCDRNPNLDIQEVADLYYNGYRPKKGVFICTFG